MEALKKAMASRQMDATPPRLTAPEWTSPAWKQIGVGGTDKVSLPASSDEEDDAAQSADGAPLQFRFSWRKLWRYAGPGWLMSLAYLDPGNLESNLQQGAYTRLSIVWVLWWATVTGFVLQEMSARLGLVTGKDLAQAVREEYPRWLSLVVYVMMEVAVIGADVQEVVASGIAFNLLSHGSIPVWVGCLITAVDTITFLAVGYLGVRYLEGLVCVLIGIMSLCFFVNLGNSGLHAWKGVLAGWLVPTMPPSAFTQIVGTIGAVIMPHNLYLHSGLVLSRKVRGGQAHALGDVLNGPGAWTAQCVALRRLHGGVASTEAELPKKASMHASRMHGGCTEAWPALRRSPMRAGRRRCSARLITRSMRHFGTHASSRRVRSSSRLISTHLESPPKSSDDLRRPPMTSGGL